MRVTARRQALGGIVLAAALGASVAPAPASAQASPTVTLDRTGTAAGEEMAVTGNGWPAGATLIVELCGHGGLGGSTDCDVPNQRTAGVAADGTFRTPLTSGIPPRPCPCVVKATDQATRQSAIATIAVQNVPTVPITEDETVRQIEIQSAELHGGSWTEWFGAESSRTLELVLENTGDVPVDQPVLTVTWGRGTNPTGFVDTPTVEAMAPGETRTITVALDRGPFAVGRSTALAEVQGFGDPGRARATSSTYPWALVVIALLAIQVVLVRVRNRLRHRLAPAPAPAPADLVLALPTPDGGVIDLRGVAAVMADDGPIDLRERASADLDEEWLVALQSLVDDDGDEDVFEPVLEPVAELVADPVIDLVAEPIHADGSIDDLLDEHRQTMRVLTVDLMRSFDESADRVRGEVLALQRQAQAALDHAADLSEALIDAAVRRAEELRASADDLLRVAEARAEEVVAAAEAAAASLRRATAERSLTGG